MRTSSRSGVRKNVRNAKKEGKEKERKGREVRNASPPFTCMCVFECVVEERERRRGGERKRGLKRKKAEKKKKEKNERPSRGSTCI